MTPPTLVIGVDPGPTTGIVAIAYRDPDGGVLAPIRMFLQCDNLSAAFFVRTILDQFPDYIRWVALEQFVIGNRSGRSGTASAGLATRNVIGELTHLVDFGNVRLRVHNAGGVKPWATDKRLDAAGLLAPTKGMNHARDAARHALFCAVKQGIVSDPLSPQLAAVR